MAVKHGWLFNSLAAVELLTQFLIHVVINLVFVSLLSKYKYDFFLRRVCRLFVVSPHLQLAAGRGLSEQPQRKTSSVPSACCAHGYCIWENVGFFFLMPNICGKCCSSSWFLGLWVKTICGLLQAYSLALPVSYPQLLFLQSCGGFCRALYFLSCAAVRYLDPG